MDRPEEFKRAVYDFFYRGSARSVMGILDQPPGQEPREDWVRLSQWFHRLSDDDVAMAQDLVRLATGLAIFNVCVALDGDDRVIRGDDISVVAL